MTTPVETQVLNSSHIAGADSQAVGIAHASLLGIWSNINKATQDVVKIVLTIEQGVLAVEAYGACSLTPGKWGVAPGLAYTEDGRAGAAVAFSAQFTFSSSTVFMTAHLLRKELIVQTFTHFTEGSERPDLYTTNMMVRSTITPVA